MQDAGRETPVTLTTALLDAASRIGRQETDPGNLPCPCREAHRRTTTTRGGGGGGGGGGAKGASLVESHARRQERTTVRYQIGLLLFPKLTQLDLTGPYDDGREVRGAGDTSR